MTMDPIADMLTRIRNANTAKHDTVDIPASRMKTAIAQILLDEGYINKYEIIDDGNFKAIHITLKYSANKSERIISGIKRISIISTNQGVITDRKARELNVGGEVLAFVW